jgi:hypothetical protein
VGSVCKKINRICANEDKDMKLTFWSNVAVSRDLVELCLKDHQKLGQRIYQIRSMVANVGEVAAKVGNVKVFKWALWNEYFHFDYWDDDIFIDIAENGHIKILELADSKEELAWYSRDSHFGRCCGQKRLGTFELSSRKETKHFQFELYKNVCQRGLH